MVQDFGHFKAPVMLLNTCLMWKWMLKRRIETWNKTEQGLLTLFCLYCRA